MSFYFKIKALRGVIGKKPRSERVDTNVNVPSEIGKFNIPKNPEILSVKITNPPEVAPEVVPIQNTACPAKVPPIENEVKIQGGGGEIPPDSINVPKNPEKPSIEITNPPMAATPEAVFVKNTACPTKVVPKETEVKIQGGGVTKRPSILKVSKSQGIFIY